jgi:hypothetical protein
MIPGINGPDGWVVGGTSQLTSCGSSIFGEMEIGVNTMALESCINSLKDDHKLTVMFSIFHVGVPVLIHCN